MRKTVVILLFFLSFIKINAVAQPQWKFYIAFEDNTGARDTLWCIWDTLATSMGVDSIYNEQAVQLDYSEFNVYIFNQNGDTTKTSALDSLGAHQLLIDAINYQHPINITWDSTILHQYLPFLATGFANYARIDNDYFFYTNNCLPCQQYDMWIDNSAYAPWYPWASQSQFPMSIYVLSDPSIGLEENSVQKSVFYPNPAGAFIEINSSELIVSWKIYSMQSSLVLKNDEFMSSRDRIDLLTLSPGLYFIETVTTSGNSYSYKLIKI